MNIIWHYLDKRGAAINALKDYGSMQYIIDHTDEEIDTVHDRMSSGWQSRPLGYAERSP